MFLIFLHTHILIYKIIVYIFNCKSYTNCVQCCISNVFNNVIFFKYFVNYKIIFKSKSDKKCVQCCISNVINVILQ